MDSRKIFYLFLIVAVAGVVSYTLYSFLHVQEAPILNVPTNDAVSTSNGKDSQEQQDDVNKADTQTVVKPVIIGAKIEFDNTGQTDVVKVIPNATGGKGSVIIFAYEWTKNGLPAGNAVSISDFSRGDKLAVKITPFDGKIQGEPKTFESEVKNSPPRIVDMKEIGSAENFLAYKVTAFDQDGDTLSYSFVEAPKGMTIDKDGIIRWSFGKEDYGKTLKVKVKVSDGHGGETEGDINFQIGAK